MSDFNGQPSHLKGGGLLRQSPTRGLAHSKSRQELSTDGTVGPLVPSTEGTVGPLVPSTEGATIKSYAP